MPINQPVKALIDAGDFQNGSYSFAVESVVNADVSPGRLVVSSSAGYLLTSSQNDQPRREQMFDHQRQPDGSWLAAGQIVLALSGDQLIDGKIFIQNSLAELVVLPIAVTSMAVARSQTTALAISQPSLTFAPTTPGTPSYLILTVARQQTDGPVTLTTDEKALFQLATDSHPHFRPTITFNPSPKGSYVHVRYMADNRGVHSGQLLLTSATESRSVTLTGRSKASMPALSDSSDKSKKWMALVPVLVIGCLALINSNSPLFSDSQPGVNTNQPVFQADSRSEMVHKDDAARRKNSFVQTKRGPKPVTTAAPLTSIALKKSDSNKPDSVLVAEQHVAESKSTVRNASARLSSSHDYATLSTNTVNRSVRENRRNEPQQSGQESDLERELNRTDPK